jgi:hypothetical protein
VGGNKALTSRHLGLDRKTLYRKLKEYSIAEERAAAESAASSGTLESTGMSSPPPAPLAAAAAAHTPEA